MTAICLGILRQAIHNLSSHSFLAVLLMHAAHEAYLAKIVQHATSATSWNAECWMPVMHVWFVMPLLCSMSR